MRCCIQQQQPSGLKNNSTDEVNGMEQLTAAHLLRAATLCENLCDELNRTVDKGAS